MIGKTNWTTYIHTIRQKELDIIQNYFSNKRFHFGLEIGAGDGFQTMALSTMCDHFISSDLNFLRIRDNYKLANVTYIQCDADAMRGSFKPHQFDFIFSSNVLEHLLKPQDFLIETNNILMPEGYSVHIVPNRWMKFFYIIFFYPHLLTIVWDRIAGLFQGKKIFRGGDINNENNINVVAPVSTHRFRKLFLPQIHGNFPTHVQEFISFGRKSWEKYFAHAGFSVVSYKKGPAFSGYGFGFDICRAIVEWCGISSEHIFILKKNHDQK